MALSEQEQIEIFSGWWKENGTAVVVTVALSLALYGGWTGWRSHQQAQAEKASALFQQILDLRNGKTTDASSGSKLPAIAELADQLKKDYSQTYYGQAVHLLLADEAVKKQDLAQAEQELTTLVDEKPREPLAVTAHLRLARVLYAEAKFEAALAQLDGSVPDAYKSLYAELRGDIFSAQGQDGKARDAYNDALSSLAKENESQRQTLEMKLAHVAKQG
jgi:predicted negative regulator of RcsB-dependent stress response